MSREPPTGIPMNGKQYHIHTFGCQMNLADSERMAGVLESKGYSCTENPGDADVLIYNTCSIRDKAEQKVYSALGRQVRLNSCTHFVHNARSCPKTAEKSEHPLSSGFLLWFVSTTFFKTLIAGVMANVLSLTLVALVLQAKRKRQAMGDLKIVVAGCVAQQEGQALLRRVPELDLVMGPQHANRYTVDTLLAHPGHTICGCGEMATPTIQSYCCFIQQHVHPSSQLTDLIPLTLVLFFLNASRLPSFAPFPCISQASLLSC